MVYPFPLFLLGLAPLAHRAGGTAAVVALVVGVVLATALYFYLFHLCSRLQFAYFEMVVNRGEMVAPAWRNYGPQSRRWTGVKILFGIVVTLACAAPMMAYIHRILPLLQSNTPGQPPSPQMFAAIFAGYGIIFLLFGSFYLVSSLLTDFIVPSLALENTSLAEAFRRMFALIRQEPGQFTLYTLLKTVLAIAAVMGATIIWEIVFLLCSVILALIAFLCGFILHMIGIPSVVLTVIGVFIAVVWYLFAILYAMFIVLGPVYTFLDAYALYFLGGRYPQLGDLLDRSTPPPAYAYPTAFPPPPQYQPLTPHIPPQATATPPESTQSELPQAEPPNPPTES
jgi:hypothetical protein